MLLDFSNYLTKMHQYRHRICIVHTEPNLSANLSKYMQKTTEHFGGKYVNLTDIFIKDSKLGKAINLFGPDNLNELLIEQSRGNSLLVVDHIDFLVDTLDLS